MWDVKNSIMGREMKISIITVCRNTAKTVADALASVAAQQSQVKVDCCNCRSNYRIADPVGVGLL